MAFDIVPNQTITDTVSTGIPDGGTQVGGGQANALQIWTALNIDATALAQTIIVPQQTGHFVAFQLLAELVSLTGSGAVPTLTIGSNAATYNNVMTATALTSLTVANTLFALTRATGAKALDIGSNDIQVNVSVASTYTTYVVNVYLVGYIR